VVIVVDFDGTVVDVQNSATPTLHLKAGAREGLESLKRAGHTLLLCSARANRAQRIDFQLDPLVRSGDRRVRLSTEEGQHALARLRYQEMLDFVAKELPGVFNAVDDGCQGKAIADVYLDDRAVRVGPGVLGIGWRGIMEMYGQIVYGDREGGK
jgi:hypothetical protein